MSILQQMKPQVDATVSSLAEREFRVDPIAGSLFSRLVSVMSSAYKRHGNIIENAIVECLGTNPRYEVWRVDRFGVHQQAQTTVVAALNDLDSLNNTHLPYVGDGAGEKQIQLDAVVFDRDTEVVSTYEIKRGNGSHDSGKKESIKKNALLAKILLKSHCEEKGFVARTSKAHVIFYYGIRSIPSPMGIIGEEMDEHFEMPIWEHIEEVNSYFRSSLFEMISR